MSLKLSLLVPQLSHFIPYTPHFLKTTKKLTCKASKYSDKYLSSTFAKQVEKIHTKQLQTDEAMDKSRQLLVKEICKYFDMNEDEMKKKWDVLNDDEKWVFVEGFVNDWAEFFYPLSIRCVKDMVDEYFDEQVFGNDVSKETTFSDFMKFWGF